MAEGRRCLFCGKPAGSAEHVIAEWLSKAMEKRDIGITRTNRQDGEVVREFPPIKFEHFRCKKVCHDCNTGWMHHLEDDFNLNFKELVIPRAFDDGEKVDSLIRNNWDTLVRWLLKTAIVCDAASGTTEHKIIPEIFYATEHLDINAHDFHVFAAEIMEDNVGYELNKQVKVSFPDSTSGYVIEDGTFLFLIQLNRLGLALVHCPNYVPGFKSALGIMGKQIVPISPSCSGFGGMSVMHLFFTIRLFHHSITYFTKEQVANNE